MFTSEIEGIPVLIGEVSFHAVDGAQRHGQVHQVLRALNDLVARFDIRKETVKGRMLRAIHITPMDDVVIDQDAVDADDIHDVLTFCVTVRGPISNV